MKQLLIILSFLLLYSPLFGQSEETCYVAAYSKDSEDFDRTLLSNISVSLISEFLKEVEPLPPAGISMDACVYQIDAVKVKDTTFVTFKGKNLNSFGNSKLSGPDGFQESLLKALYRALEDKRKLICDAYGEYIEKCGGTVKKIPADKIGKIREMQSKYDLLGKKINVLDTRIEKLNSGTFIALTNPHSFEKEMRAILLFTLWRDLNRSKWEGGGRKWFKSGDEKTHVKFVGEIKNGAPNGMGTSTYPDGSKYEGEWKEGVETGQGTYIFGKGDVRMIRSNVGFKGHKFVGELKEGKFWNGIYSYGSGKKDSKYVNGEKQ